MKSKIEDALKWFEGLDTPTRHLIARTAALVLAMLMTIIGGLL